MTFFLFNSSIFMQNSAVNTGPKEPSFVLTLKVSVIHQAGQVKSDK
jgi:hypothetical protein